VDWIYLAQDKAQWHALVNTIMKLQVLDQPSAYHLLKTTECCFKLKIVLVLYRKFISK
jgi:hypothetical protein